MNKAFIYLVPLFALLIAFSSCKKDPLPGNPAGAFELYVKNDFNQLEAQYSIWLSDADGKIVAYRQIPGEDSIILQVPYAGDSAHFDCTIAKIAAFDATGSGVKDTSIVLTTYTNLRSGESLNLRNAQGNVQFTDLKFKMSGMSTFDTIIVPDGITFARPNANNDFYGQYKVINSGTFWMRFLVNNEHFWRFAIFENVGNGVVDLGAPDYTVFPKIIASPSRINFPYNSTWKYKIEGIIDSNQNRYLPMGDLARAPGGFVPVVSSIDVFEPETDDVFFPPPPRPYKGFRVFAQGTDASSGGYNYTIDRYYTELPENLPIPNWDIEATTAANSRYVSAKCVNDFDALLLSRSKSGTPNYKWEVNLKPAANAVVVYKLPDVPKELSSRFSILKNYNFDPGVRVSAESYDRFSNFSSIQRQRMTNDDAYWQAKAGFLAREEVY